jgi:hypothetical protein
MLFAARSPRRNGEERLTRHREWSLLAMSREWLACGVPATGGGG